MSKTSNLSFARLYGASHGWNLPGHFQTRPRAALGSNTGDRRSPSTDTRATATYCRAIAADARSANIYIRSKAADYGEMATYHRSDATYIPSTTTYHRSDAAYIPSTTTYLRSDAAYVRAMTVYMNAITAYMNVIASYSRAITIYMNADAANDDSTSAYTRSKASFCLKMTICSCSNALFSSATAPEAGCAARKRLSASVCADFLPAAARFHSATVNPQHLPNHP